MIEHEDLYDDLPAMPIPRVRKIGGWNWGAFALTPLWAAAMNRWGWVLISLLSLLIAPQIPFAPLIPSLYLGARGNALAWRSRTWLDYNHFHQTQAIWQVLGIFMTTAYFLVALLMLFERA